jgi:hypothetical protein
MRDPDMLLPLSKGEQRKRDKKEIGIYVASLGFRAEDETDLQDLQAILKAEESSDQQRSFSSKNPPGPPDKSPLTADIEAGCETLASAHGTWIDTIFSNTQNHSKGQGSY